LRKERIGFRKGWISGDRLFKELDRSIIVFRIFAADLDLSAKVIFIRFIMVDRLATMTPDRF
jgi:hypothetical protein